MKREIIVAAAAISVTGAASANLFTTSGLPRVPPSSAHDTPPVAAAQRTDLAERPAQASASAPAQKASVDIRQAPVPMQPRQRAPVASAFDNPNEFYAKAQALVTQPSVASERRGESAARAAIEADGYKNVQVLRPGDNGVWHAKAFRGKTEVQLIVDARGSVSMAD
jgi:hypothetical protein